IADTIQWGCPSSALGELAAMSGGIARCASSVEELRAKIDELTQQARGSVEAGFDSARPPPSFEKCQRTHMRVELPSGLGSNPINLQGQRCCAGLPRARRSIPWPLLGGLLALLGISAKRALRRRAR